MSPKRSKHFHTQSRGYLKGANVDALAQRLHHSPYDQLWAQLERRTRQTIAQTNETNFGITAGSLGWHSHTPMLPEAALLVRLNRDEEALTYIKNCIDYLAAYQPESERKHLLHSHAQIAVAADMVRSDLPKESIATLTQFMRDVAIAFNNSDPASLGQLGNNIAWVKSIQTATCALLWGEDSQAKKWQQAVEQGVRHTIGYLQFGMDAQGHSFEGTGYGQSVLRFMYPFVELLKLTGFDDLYKSQPRLHTAANAAIHSMFPDRSFLTNDNDHGLSAASNMAYLLLTHNAYKDPNHLAAWYAYQGPDHPIRPWGDQEPWLLEQVGSNTPRPQDNSSLFLSCLYWQTPEKAPAPQLEKTDLPCTQFAKGTGKLQMRSSWSTDATFIQLLGSGRSHMSQTHRHADAGHFSIFAHGQYLAIDTGRYNSDEDQHSVILVDGECHAPVAPGWGMDHHAGRLHSFAHQPPVTYTQADMANVKGCYWAVRHFLTIDYSTPADPDRLYMVCVDDINKDNKHHDFWWQLQGHPQATFNIHHADAPLVCDGPHATLQRDKAKLDLNWVTVASKPAPSNNDSEAASENPWPLKVRVDEKEWQWPYGKDNAPNAIEEAGLLWTSVRRPRLVTELHQQGGRLLSLVSPRRADETALTVKRFHTASTMGLEIQLGQWTDTIITSPSHGFIDNEKVSAMTQLLWYRRDPNGKVIQSWTLEDSPVTWK